METMDETYDKLLYRRKKLPCNTILLILLLLTQIIQLILVISIASIVTTDIKTLSTFLTHTINLLRSDFSIFSHDFTQFLNETTSLIDSISLCASKVCTY